MSERASEYLVTGLHVPPGHAPLFADPSFADFSHKIGLVGIDTTAFIYLCLFVYRHFIFVYSFYLIVPLALPTKDNQ